MKLKFILVFLALTILSGCSFLSRDSSGYENSNSVSDLELPPELNLPKRDTNYDIPDIEKVEPEETTEVEEAVEDAPASAAETSE